MLTSFVIGLGMAGVLVTISNCPERVATTSVFPSPAQVKYSLTNSSPYTVKWCTDVYVHKYKHHLHRNSLLAVARISDP